MRFGASHEMATIETALCVDMCLFRRFLVFLELEKHAANPEGAHVHCLDQNMSRRLTSVAMR